MHGKTKNDRSSSNLKKNMVELHWLAEKDNVRLKLLKDTLKSFVSFRNK